uniref:adenylate cyclase n=1 Tax=Romanomermis culicivorax TaxID=13658 RepID=A0A915HHT3_ROMCU
HKEPFSSKFWGKFLNTFPFNDFPTKFWTIHYPSRIMSKPEYSCIEKIKTISTTYMAASGLTPQTCDMNGMSHLTALANYALDIMHQLDEINEHSFNSFKMRI